VTRSAGSALLLLCLQAVLLCSAPGLLPVWTDELFTLQTVARPVPEILQAVRDDIHPPLYYLLAHAWPWHGIDGLRAFSAVWALAAGAALAWFWRDRAPRFALAMFALSPCMLLYGRMARSYSMQAAFALLAVALFERWMQSPGSIRWAAGASVSVLALLYTHYVPGAAILVGFLATGWRKLGWKRVAVFASVTGGLYLPWAVLSLDALRRWGAQSSFSATYALSGNGVLEQFLKAGYGATSLAIGESFLALSIPVAPLVVLLALRGTRQKLFPLSLIAVASLVGWIGVSRWVSYPFIPARLLWLLPFLCLATAAGIDRLGRPWLGAIVLLSYATSAALYFRRENFLNLGYVAPLPEIVATLNREAGPSDLILLDFYNTDFPVVSAGLTGRTPHVVLEPARIGEGRSRIPSAESIWIVRNTRDASPGLVTSAVEAEACAGRQRRDTLLDPYAPWQQAVLRTVGSPLTHFYLLTVCGPR
jgi:hypothetical protein